MNQSASTHPDKSPPAPAPAVASGLPVEVIAHACHHAITLVQAANNEPVSPPWEELGPADRENTRTAVLMAQQGHTAPDLHRAWAYTKRVQGWTYGPLKDAQARTHPCLVDDYTQLPYAQQVKDHIIVALTHVMTARNAP